MLGELLPERTRADGTGMRLEDFVQHEDSVAGGLSEMHVAALRAYTTAAYAAINNPLRDLDRRDRGEPHPLALTVTLLRDAVSRLRAVGARGADANKRLHLFRGMRSVALDERFASEGGSELAPMSTTSDVSIAIKYSASTSGIVMRLATESAIERGADVSYLSAFPGEKEVLFPPLCYLQPTGRDWAIELGGSNFSVIEVRPRL
jgi:hypothetical protein